MDSAMDIFSFGHVFSGRTVLPCTFSWYLRFSTQRARTCSKWRTRFHTDSPKLPRESETKNRGCARGFRAETDLHPFLLERKAIDAYQSSRFWLIFCSNADTCRSGPRNFHSPMASGFSRFTV